MQRIFISGASSGLGAALAQEYAAEGVILGLLARRKNRLSEVAAACRKQGAIVYIYVADITDTDKTEKCVQDFLRHAKGIDTVIANAGISTGSSKGGMYDTRTLLNVIDVNVSGVIRLVNSFLPTVIEQKYGRVVAISSVAAFFPLPGAYSASKIAVKSLMDSWRRQYGTRDLTFTTLYPGFVESEMTAGNSFKMPFIIPASQAAHLMKTAIEKRRSNYMFPFIWRPLMLALQLLPESLLAKLITRRKKP